MLIRDIITEAHPLEKERQALVKMFKQSQSAGIPSHVPSDAMLNILKRPQYSPEYIEQIIAHPKTTVKDLNLIRKNLFNNPQRKRDPAVIKQMMDQISDELTRRGQIRIKDFGLPVKSKTNSPELFAPTKTPEPEPQDDYSYRDTQPGAQKSGANPDAEKSLGVDIPDSQGIDLDALSYGGDSPQQMINRLQDEYGMTRVRAQKMVDDWQDSQYNRTVKNLYAKPIKKPKGNTIQTQMARPSTMAQAFHQLLKSFVDDGYSDKDIIELVTTDSRIGRRVNQEQLPLKLKAIRSMK